jgi:hypothetical protein
MYFGGAVAAFEEIFKALFLTYLIIGILNNERRLEKYANVLVFFIILIAFNGIYQYYNGTDIFGTPILIDYTTTAQGEVMIKRIQSEGTLSGPNDLCSAFLIALPFVLTMIFRKRTFLSKALGPVLLAILGCAVFFTRSRGGFLAAVAICYYYFFNLFKHRIKSRIVRLSFGFILAFIIFAAGSATLGREYSSREPSAMARVEIWSQGLTLLKENLLFGVGHERFEEFVEHSRSTHSTFVKSFAETGLIGFFFYMGILYLVFRNFGIIKESDYFKESRSLKVRLIADDVKAALVGYLTQGIFLQRAYNLLYFIMLGLAFAVFNIAGKAEAEKIDFGVTKKDVRNIIIYEFLAIFAIYLLVKSASHGELF